MRTSQHRTKVEVIDNGNGSVADPAELLGVEVGDLVRRLFCLLVVPGETKPITSLLTAQEVAALLKTKTQVVYRLARNKELPVVNLGQRMMRFTEVSVHEFVARGGVCGEQISNRVT
jgi:excisionase family DNA binding protein